MDEQELFDQLLKQRGLTGERRQQFLAADYKEVAEAAPFLLPDMAVAVRRLLTAHKCQEPVLIYGDYDADGVTATALLVDGFRKLGFKNVSCVVPDRFKEGYGLNRAKIEWLADQQKPAVIVTVDCGSMNYAEIELANQLGIDVIVTDHHNLSDELPPAVAVINPKRPDSKFPVKNMAGVTVAFNLICALQTKLPRLKFGQEKWLLDLVAIGTITDLIELTDYNRVLVKYGLLVLAKTRRPGLKALLKVAKVDLKSLDADTIGFIIGPRLNAAGRLENAQLALDVLLAKTETEASQAVLRLDFLNQKRRALQDKIFQEAELLVESDSNPVLVLKNQNWHEGVVGIVASKIMESRQRPVFILSESADYLKGSARSFGDFSIFSAIESSRQYLVSGGGHQAAGGVKLEKTNFDLFRKTINDYYSSLGLIDQERFLKITADIAIANFRPLTLKFHQLLQTMAPFGMGNPEPILKLVDVKIERLWRMGKDKEHLKIKLRDNDGRRFVAVLFGDGQKHQVEAGDRVSATIKLVLNTWQGKSEVEGRLLDLTKSLQKSV